MMHHSHANSQPIAVITGAAGGLGAASSQLLAENGWTVYAADLNLTSLQEAHKNHTHIHCIAVDVTDTHSIENAKLHIQKECPAGIHAVVNFAGIVLTGSSAEVPPEQIQRLLDINVMGTYRINHALLPMLMKTKGRIVNISSETGWQSGAPFNGPYAMSKHAIEAYSDSLRRELAFYDMHVVKIQPGPFKTNMVASLGSTFDKAIAQSKLFAPHLTKIKDMALQEQKKAHPPALLAQTVYQVLTAKKPKAAYSVKPDFGRSFLEKLPTGIADKLIRKVLQP